MRRSLLLAAVSALLLMVASSDELPVFFTIGGSGGHGSLSQAYSDIRSLAGRSSTDIWAVGIHRGPGPDESWIEHWDGVAWTRMPADLAGGHPDRLNGVAVTGASDAWSVGYSAGVDGLEERALIEHWDGRRWSAVRSIPNPGIKWNELDGVAALAPNDVWAVGYYMHSTSPARVLIEHWNGSEWKLISAPSPGTNWNQLTAVSASGSNDVWAVGWQQSDGPQTPLIEHWDGRQWTVVPASAGARGQLQAVRAISPGLAWAVGSPEMDGSQRVLRWDGAKWSVMPAPPRTQQVELWGISAASPADVWLVGDRSFRNYGIVLEHWDGVAWTIVDAPGHVGIGQLSAVLTVSSNDVWIAGTQYGGQPLTLREHWDGLKWIVVEAGD
jgi:hypothetical protein